VTIHPRQTQSRTAWMIGDFNHLTSVDTNLNRPPRHCPCGTRLRRSKPGWEVLCDACDDKRIRSLADVAVEEFIATPSPIPVASSRHHATATCRCGRPMWRQSKTCRRCYYERRAQASMMGGSRPPTAAPNGASIPNPEAPQYG
jgi:hypothetical protein